MLKMSPRLTAKGESKRKKQKERDSILLENNTIKE